MPVSMHDIKAGRRYATANDQVRRVLEIANDAVTYEERARTASFGSAIPRAMIGVEHFARQVNARGSVLGWQ